jgi:hypothetical protein
MKKASWWERDSTLIWLSAVPSLVASVIAGWKASYDKLPWWIPLTFAGTAAWSILVTSLKARKERRREQEDEQKHSPRDLNAAVHATYAGVAHRIKLSEATKARNGLRICMHRVAAQDEYLEQCTPYVGGKGRPPGRRFSIRSGIIGKVALSGHPHVACRSCSDNEAFIRELATDWHYPIDEARTLTSDRQTWMGVPLKDHNDQVVAVVYFDSNQKGFFSEDVQEGIIEVCGTVLATFVRHRYLKNDE